MHHAGTFHLTPLAALLLATLAAALPFCAIAQPYVAHPGWASGGYKLDQFAAGSSGRYRAVAADRLENGNVVVVGSIQFGGTGSPRHFGMVKYDGRGNRVPWTGALSDQTWYGNEYVGFPYETPGWLYETLAVHDVKVQGSYIYVLTTLRYAPTGKRFASLAVYRDDGERLQWWSGPDDDTVRDGVAIDIWGQHVIMLGRRSLSTADADGGYWTRRFTINSEGTLSAQPTIHFWTGYRRVPVDISFRRSSFLAPVDAPAYHVALTSNWGGGGLDDLHVPCLYTTNPDDSFAGAACWFFNDSTGDNNHARAVHSHAEWFLGGGGLVSGEVLYLSANIDRGGAEGIGVAKWVRGDPDESFGNQGEVVYGGCQSSGTHGEGCVPIGYGHIAHHPLARGLYADSGGVYVIGRNFQPQGSGSPPLRRPIFMHADPATGQLRQLSRFAISYPNSRFTALVARPGPAHARQFIVAGESSDADTTEIDDGGPRRFLTTHLVPGLGVFSDRFEE